MQNRFVEEALRGKSQATIKTYLHAIKQFANWLEGAGTDLSNYGRSDVQQYIDYLVSKRKSASTVNKIWNAIKIFSKWANKEYSIEDISVIKATNNKNIAPRSLSKIELNRLVREIDRSRNLRDIAILQLILNTGLRVAEAVSLDIFDVEISDRKGHVTVRKGKGNKERTLPLNKEARRALCKYLDGRFDNEEALFLSNRRKRISVRSVQHLIEKHGFNVHALRHTFITGLVRNGEDISIIQSLTGHSTADMILRYSAPTEEDKANAVEDIWVSRNK
ncbi:integrase/recombinase XerC/integrase/recombinase XerD [Psychrobacillus sp. OK028]|uniref:tyrosine-type recombinase/integrase n=1 Tax=Psychrobacillus sp. OK028 TaxID=1884359 RepID=UPI00087EF7D4|nr:tyrosine-type recombinase/integrase [Psychrobacillus sp. OK028]SDO02900.1 integrase/recombinase XerC/integrase/recombinase XerD [Psychrobacillus sp. OK028]